MIQITVAKHEDTNVIALAGVADVGMLSMLFGMVEEYVLEDGPVVMEMSDVTIVAPQTVDGIVSDLVQSSRVRVVARGEVRRALVACGLAPAMTCAGVAEAIDAMRTTCY